MNAKSLIAVFAANLIWINPALAQINVDDFLFRATIRRPQECTMKSRKDGSAVVGLCGHKVDADGNIVGYREYTDAATGSIFQEYLVREAEHDSSGKVTRHAEIRRFEIKLNDTEPVEVFSRAQSHDETDQQVATGSKVLAISGVVLGVAALAGGAYIYKSHKNAKLAQARRQQARDRVPSPTITEPTRRTSTPSRNETRSRSTERTSRPQPTRVPEPTRTRNPRIDAAPRTVNIPFNSRIGARQRVSINGHIPRSQVPSNSYIVNTQGHHSVVFYQDPLSNQLLTYMIWDDLLLNHRVDFGSRHAPIDGQSPITATPLPSGAETEIMLHGARNTDDATFATTSDRDIARAFAEDSNPTVTPDYVVRADIVSDRTVTSDKNDFFRVDESTTRYEPPTPRYEAPTPVPYDPPTPRYESPAPAPYEPPAPSPSWDPPSPSPSYDPPSPSPSSWD